MRCTLFFLLTASVYAGPDRYGNLPLYFERNTGQHAPAVRYFARSTGYSFSLTGDEAVLSGRGGITRLRFSASQGLGRLESLDPQAGISNYFIGDDRSSWRTGIPHFGRVRANGVYPGVDVVFHGNGRALEFDFEVAPHADPRRIELEFAGAEKPSIDSGGRLHVGGFSMPPPRSWQTAGGQKTEVQASYRLKRGNHVAIDLADYDPQYALTIDPILAYSSYVGGAGADTVGGIAVDIVGNSYLCGSTASPDFPGRTPLQPPLAGVDVFVLGLNSNGTDILFVSFFGGNGLDTCNGIALDADGGIYTAGSTASTNFPTAAPVQAANAGATDGFITKLNSTGGMVYSTYIGGEGVDVIRGIALDAARSPYVTGHTYSSGFPVTAGAFGTAKLSGAGSADAFAMKLTPAGNAIAYSTFLAGTNEDFGLSIAVDLAGSAYIGGQTLSVDFPVTGGALQPVLDIAPDGFLTKLNPAGSALVFSTYLGGDGLDAIFSIAVDDAGRVYAAGESNSLNFPRVGGLNAGASLADGFVSKINSLGSSLIYSTLLGGVASDSALAIKVNQTGQAYVTGRTASFNYPITLLGYQQLRAGLDDAFLAVLNAAGSGLTYSTYFGGANYDVGVAIALDRLGDAYFAGQTFSADFPVTADRLDGSYNGDQDIFVARFAGFGVFPCLPSITGTAASYPASGGSGMFNIVADSACSWSGASSARFVTLVFGTLGSGNGLLTYNVAANTGNLPRTASISVSGNIVHLIQSAGVPAAPFDDVPLTHPYADYVTLIKAGGITSGCSAAAYCPGAPTTRSQMAVFIIRALMGGDNFPYNATPYFADVPATHPHFPWVQKMRELGITTGCSAFAYCPDDPVTRGQMSVFLIRALVGDNFSYSPSPYFSDVAVTHPYFSYIQKMKEWGITTGCTATQYCGDDSTTRGQMAVFLVRAFLSPR